MEGEMGILATVWFSVVASLSYCYIVGRLISKGIPRLLLVLPIISLFLLLPLKINSVNLGGQTGFFIAWLANFKLLLFAFGKGPLAAADGSLPRFVAVGCLPIKVQQVPDVKSTQKCHKSPWNYAVKGVLLAAIIRAYDYSDRIHPNIILLLYCLHIYFSLEIILAGLAFTARALFRLELEPQFNHPHLATSLQDFWGHRWNLTVTAILRPTVYEPVRHIWARVMGRKWAQLPAILAVFLVSGIMHDLLMFYFGQGKVGPTCEMTGFFLFHGACVAAEVAVKKVVAGRWRLPGLVSGSLTSAFVIFTGLWWFLPPFLKIEADKRAIEEYRVAGAFVQDAVRAVSSQLLQRL